MTGSQQPAPDWNSVVRDAWNRRAPAWDISAERNSVAPDRAADLQRMMQALEIGPGSRLLDAGCGAGQFSIAFATRGCQVTGVDLSPAMIALAREHAEQARVEVDFAVGDLAHLPDRFADFDAIHARVCLQFVESIPGVLQEFRRVLRPGGRLLASVPGALSPIYIDSWERHLPAGQPGGVNYVTPWELEHLLRSLGWQVLDDGWGRYSATSDGNENPFSATEMSSLPVPLQQAAATAWTIIAR